MTNRLDGWSCIHDWELVLPQPIYTGSEIATISLQGVVGPMEVGVWEVFICNAFSLPLKAPVECHV